MKIYIIREKETGKMWNSSIWDKAGMPTLYHKRSFAQGRITTERKAREDWTDCPSKDFWNNAEIVECKLIIPK